MEIKKTVTLTFETSHGNELIDGATVIYITKERISKIGVYRGLGKSGCIVIEDAYTQEERNVRVDSIEYICIVNVEYVENR